MRGRQAALARRRSVPLKERPRRSEAIWEVLRTWPKFLACREVLLYVSVGSEVDTGVIRRGCLSLGMGVFAPRCDPTVKGMDFFAWDDAYGLQIGPVGVPEPAAGAPPARLGPQSVVLVPGVAFDRRGHRLGLGGGYYDRWLAGPGRHVLSVGLAFEEQIVDAIEARPWDVPVAWVVSDRGRFAGRA